jgi:hypothetical protein
MTDDRREHSVIFLFFDGVGVEEEEYHRMQIGRAHV